MSNEKVTVIDTILGGIMVILMLTVSAVISALPFVIGFFIIKAFI